MLVEDLKRLEEAWNNLIRVLLQDMKDRPWGWNLILLSGLLLTIWTVLC